MKFWNLIVAAALGYSLGGELARGNHAAALFMFIGIVALMTRPR